MPDIQNFSVAAGDETVITFDLTLAGIFSLDHYTVYWNAYEQTVGLPTAGVPPVIAKNSLSGGGDIQVLESPAFTVLVTLYRDDTVALLRNYYHELSIVDPSDNKITTTQGIMTVTMTENRE
jgi:hypothetical protein